MSFLSPNGILQIYETNPRIAPWVMGFDNWSSRIFKWGTNSGTGKNTVVDSGTQSQTRFSVRCKVEPTGDGTQDLGLALERGYLDTSADFVNVEVTGYYDAVKMLQSQPYTDKVTYYGPSGRHPSTAGPPTGCTGATYKADSSFGKGQIRFNKEVFHDHYVHDSWQPQDSTTSAIIKSGFKQNKRVGFKYVNFLYQRPTDQKIVRRIEIWLDVGGAISYTSTPKNQWKLLSVRTDEGDWGERMTECKCPSNTQVISWGGPHVTYRADYYQLKLSLASVYEIKAPIQTVQVYQVQGKTYDTGQLITG
jgi:hypothetical protein